MTDTLQSLGLPAAMLRSSGRVFSVNASFDKLIPSLIQDKLDRIHVTNVPANTLLAEALARQSQPSKKAVTNSIPVAAGDDHPPMILHLLPVRGAAQDIFSQASSLLIVTPVDKAAVPSARVLQGLFDLTPAEARVARSIGEAQTIEAIASSGGVSAETIRSQLKAVLSKTGLSRQQELIRLLAGKVL